MCQESVKLFVEPVKKETVNEDISNQDLAKKLLYFNNFKTI